MQKRRPFNWVEEQLLSIPTWRLITEVVIILASLAILLETDKEANPAKVIFDSAESIAIASAAVLYFKEIPERKKQKHYEAWQVIDNANGIETSYARRKALEDLHEDNISFYEVDLPKADLNGIHLSGADFCYADLSGAHLNKATLVNTLFSNANLNSADLRGANLHSADLSYADLSYAKLLYARLSNTNFRSSERMFDKSLSQ
ncbi:pentapeptide repeat-containing protein [Leptolyngbya iicbica]|uniref:Pentapeptide repeat-containing protein n=2 Tax=Cyanophyceae TaxID=3028117 RepID=A0A4Q7E1M8_9CYAN|nr:pentapeptide repeat-containing protein [Leptolyngbya sp. LK]RZM76095.1 pentapeptide repeat-containing protein [Leptolyngbya sp. LK]